MTLPGTNAELQDAQVKDGIEQEQAPDHQEGPEEKPGQGPNEQADCG
jgi:hypothetical protein